MTPSTIIRTTAEQHGVTAESILSRDKSATLARADAMTAMRNNLGMKFREIAEHFDRHTSTVHQIIGRTPKRRRVLRPTIRGVTYDSVAAAADALGISTRTIYQARGRGTLENVGAGHGNFKGHRGHGGAKPFTIGDHTWPSMAVASIALGYHDAQVAHVMRKGSDAERRALVRRYMEWSSKGGEDD